MVNQKNERINNENTEVSVDETVEGLPSQESKNLTISQNEKVSVIKKINNVIYKENSASYLILLGIFLLIFMFLLFLFKSSSDISFSSSISEEKIAQFGDFVAGVIGSVFALVGVILFYVSLKEQRQAIQENQNSFKEQLNALNSQITIYSEQKTELAETKKVFEKQNETMNIQLFESSFYSFLNVFIDNKHRLNEKYSITDIFLNTNLSFPSQKYQEFFELAEKEIHNRIKEKEDNLSVFFISFYRLMRVIETSNLSKQRKIHYHKILRANLNQSDLLLLYYNFRQKEIVKPIPIILEYNYLKHLPFQQKLEFKAFELTDISLKHFLEIRKKLSNEFAVVFQNAKGLESEFPKASFEISEVFFEVNCEADISISFSVSSIQKIRDLVLHTNFIPFKGYDPDIDEDCLSLYKLIFQVVLFDILYASKFKDETEKFVETQITETATNLMTIKYSIEEYK